MGVSMGPFRATRFARIDTSVWAGSDLPVRANAPEPICWRSHSTPTPVASMARRAASTTSGPTPSPGIKVMRCGKLRFLSLAARRAPGPALVPEGPGDYPGR